MSAMLTRLALAALTLIPLCGCPPMDENPNENGNANGDGGGETISAEARTAVIDEVEALFPTLNPDDIAGAQQAVLAKLQGISEISDAGVNPDGSVWAIFSDGRPLVVALNSPIPAEALPAESSAPKQLEGPLVIPPKPAKPSGRSQDGEAPGPYSIPFTKKAFLFNSFGQDGETINHVHAIAKWLADRGYEDVISSHDASIENFLQVTEAGLLYVQGHGTIGYLPPEEGAPLHQEIFALGTTTDRAADGSTDARYEEMLDNKELGYLVIPSIFGVPLSFGPRAASRYFLTRNFVLEHWSFAAGSWVFLDVCDGFDRVFKDACFEQGAGLFLGWDRTVRHSDSLETSQYLFSRVLGAKNLSFARKITLPEIRNRAWDFDAVLRHMSITDRSNPPNPILSSNDLLTESFSPHNNIESNHGRATLMQEAAASLEAPLLAPGIANMQINDVDGRLGINGSFGVEQGAVSVGGELAFIESWNDLRIVCRVSPAAHGAVVVAVDGHLSDPRQLSHWSGTAAVTFSGQERATETLTLNVEFRSDVQSVRDFIDGEVVYRAVPGFGCIPDNSGVQEVNVSGTLSCGVGVGGSVTISLPDPPTDAEFMPVGATNDDHYHFGASLSSGVSIDAVTGMIHYDIAYGVFQDDGVRTQSNCENQMPRDLRSDLNLSGGASGDMSPSAGYDVDFDLPITDGMNILHSVVHLVATDLPSADDPR